MCHENIYPPRFSVRISGGKVNNDVVAEFKFPGVVAFPGGQEPVNRVYLPFSNMLKRTSNSSSGIILLDVLNKESL